MDLEAARAILRDQHRAVLSTIKPDGTPQLTPVLTGLDDAGRVIISTREAAYKTRHLRRDPRAYLCVLPDTFFGRWLQVSGTAEVLSLPDAMEPLVDYYRRTAGEHPDWNEYREAMRRERRVLVRVTLTAAGPDRQG
jgi:PPOX class probable F420-dependent enzyme